jgi:hypothetical protein
LYTKSGTEELSKASSLLVVDWQNATPAGEFGVDDEGREASTTGPSKGFSRSDQHCLEVVRPGLVCEGRSCTVVPTAIKKRGVQAPRLIHLPFVIIGSRQVVLRYQGSATHDTFYRASKLKSAKIPSAGQKIKPE